MSLYFLFTCSLLDHMMPLDEKRLKGKLFRDPRRKLSVQ